MTFNTHFENLQKYPFERLRALTADIQPPNSLRHIPLSLGEPKHAPPAFVLDALTDRDMLATSLSSYPASKGSDALREAIGAWVKRRFGVAVNADTQVLPVSGTREALFAVAQALLSGQSDRRVIMPNPFYQIYEGATLLAGAAPYFVNNDATAGYQQDFATIPAEVWRTTELLYLCSPGNPTGHIMPLAQQQQLIELAHRYDFHIVADECYAELYFDEPPPSLLNAAVEMGHADFSRCLIFHSLSKRSNLPGLRSGFVAGDARLMERFAQYRTYHGCALPPHHQIASALAWSDDQHVDENRALYRQKFSAVAAILDPYYRLQQPQGGFYHWLPVPMDEQTFCQELLRHQHVTVMPGSFLARATPDGNPGSGHVRVAWVATYADCVEAAERMAEFARRL